MMRTHFSTSIGLLLSILISKLCYVVILYFTLAYSHNSLVMKVTMNIRVLYWFKTYKQTPSSDIHIYAWFPHLTASIIISQSNSGYDIPAIDTPSINSASLLILVSGTFVTQDSRFTESPKVGATLSCELHFPSKYEWIWCVEKLEKRGRGTVPSLMF